MAIPKNVRSRCKQPGVECYDARPCAGCGFDEAEAARRRALPLVQDGEKGPLRKFVGGKEAGT